MKPSPLLRLLCLLAIPAPLAAQISLTGSHSNNFDTTPGPSGTAIPTGWTLVANGNPATGLSTSDAIWAGTPQGYNAALQTDITQAGDGAADRGLSIYASGANEQRHITASFRNDTGGEITALSVNFNAVLYAARFDSADLANPRWDGLTLQLDPGSGTFTTVSPAVEAIFTNAQVTFAPGGGSPWTAGNGWATASMVAGSNKQALSGTLAGLSIAPGTVFNLRWVSKNGAVTPTLPVTPLTYTAGQQLNLNIGVDDVSITPTFEPPVVAPDAPSDLVLNVLNSSKIELTWADNSLIESGFKIERSETGTDPWTPVTTTGANSTSFTDTGLTQSTLYHYRIIATNVAGDSAPTTPASATTLADNPGEVRFVADTASVAENVLSGTVTLSVERFFDSDGAVSVNYETVADTALAGIDFVAAAGTLSWADGEDGVKAFTVTIINDSLVEPDETFAVNLSTATGGVVIASPDTAAVTITNDDFNGSIKFSAATYSAAETAGTVTLTAQRTAGSAGAISIDYATSDGTALAGTHYTTASGTLNWADGDTANKTFTVTLADDAVTNRSRTFSATLSNPGGGATLGTPGAATVTIADNETGFALYDNFSGGTVDQNVSGWSANSVGTDTQFWTRVDPADAGNQVAGVKRVSGSTVRAYYLPLGVDSIANGSNGTLFMRFRLAGGLDADRFNLSLGLSDEVTPSNNFAHFETQAALANTANAATCSLGVRNAGVTTTSATLSKSTWYNIWFVANNTADTYDVHLNTGTAGADAGNRIATGFTFRNSGSGVASNPLRHVLLVLGSPTANNPEVYLDDVYLDRTAVNLANPLATMTAAEQWRQLYFGSPLNSGDGADSNDFDKDGQVNLLERAFKRIPNDASSVYLPIQSMVTDTGINYLAITYLQLAGGTGTRGVNYTVDGMKYTVEYDADLVAPWSQGGITVVSVSAPVNGVETVTVRLNTPVSVADKQFIRVAVESVAP
jgi:hypothetical protein